MKQTNSIGKKPVKFHDIHMPKDTPMGLYIAAWSFVFGFAMVWNILWLALIGFIGVITCVIIRMSQDDIDYYVPAAVVEKIEAETLQRKLST
jgi:cytochrome o ubiquinol oxidase subunit I